jgi:hypothetical protein
MRCVICNKPVIYGRRTCSKECLKIRNDQVKAKYNKSGFKRPHKIDEDSTYAIKLEIERRDHNMEIKEISAIIEDSL